MGIPELAQVLTSFSTSSDDLFKVQIYYKTTIDVKNRRTQVYTALGVCLPHL